MAVKDMTGHGCESEEEVSLQRRDPADGAGRVGSELVCLIVSLKIANRRYPAGADEDATPSPCNDCPSPTATLGEVTVIGGRRILCGDTVSVIGGHAWSVLVEMGKMGKLGSLIKLIAPEGVT